MTLKCRSTGKTAVHLALRDGCHSRLYTMFSHLISTLYTSRPIIASKSDNFKRNLRVL
jgi:hypothetical protein